MALVNKVWHEVPVHEMIVEFLQSERDELVKHLTEEEMETVDSPNTLDENQNHARDGFLWSIRGGLCEKIPLGVKWYKVEHLTDEELPELHVIARVGIWAALGADNNLMRAAALIPVEPLRNTPEDWNHPILFGHVRDGPFTILEGNHRLTALASRPHRPFERTVVIGLSPNPCYWHIYDPGDARVRRPSLLS